MNIFAIPFLLSMISMAIPAFSEPYLACVDIAQNSPAGTVCMTSAGVVFRKEVDGWRDNGQNGKLWYDSRMDAVTQINARKFCNQYGQSLPSAYPSQNDTNYSEELRKKLREIYGEQESDFVTAHSHGFLEVFKDMAGNSTVFPGQLNEFWSSTPDPESYYWAFYFRSNGHIGSNMLNFFAPSVRCVASGK